MAWSTAASNPSAPCVFGCESEGMTLFQVDRLGRCSYFVLMESTRRFKPPWTLIRDNSECYVVRDADGVKVAWLFCRDDSQRYSVGASKLTSEEARRIGKAIAAFPNS